MSSAPITGEAHVAGQVSVVVLDHRIASHSSAIEEVITGRAKGPSPSFALLAANGRVAWLFDVWGREEWKQSVSAVT